MKCLYDMNWCFGSWYFNYANCLLAGSLLDALPKVVRAAITVKVV